MKWDNAAKRLLRGQIKELCSQGDTWRDQHNWKLGEIGNWGELEIGGNWKFRGCDSPPGGTWSTRSPKAGTETGTSPKTGAIPFALKGFGGELKVSSRYQSAPSPHRRRLNLDRSHQTPREMFDILQLHSLHHEQ